MNYDDFKTNYNKTFETLIDEVKNLKSHQINLKNDIVLKHNHQKKLIEENNQNFTRDIDHFEEAKRNSILENSSELQERFNLYDLKIKELDFDQTLQILTEEFLATKEDKIKSLNHHNKKTRQEHTYKINAHEREYTAKYKEYESEVSELKKAFKNKNNEIARKLEFDLKKEKDQAIKNSAPLDRELLLVNEPIQIKTINNEIKKIRQDSLESLYQLQKETFKELENLESEHKTALIEKEKEIKIFREQLNVKIAHLEEKVSSIKLDEQFNQDMLEMDFKKVLLDQGKSNQLTLNEVKKDYLLDVNELKKILLENKYSLDLQISEILSTNYNLLKDNYEIEKNEVNEYNNQFYELQLKQIDSLSSFITNQIEFLTSFIEQFSLDVIDSLGFKNMAYFDQSFLNNIPNHSWQNFDYQFNYDRFKSNINKYKENRVIRFNKFNKELNNQIENISSLLKNIIKIMTNYINKEIEEDKNLFKDFTSHNAEVLQMANEVYQNKKINLTSKYENDIANLKSEYEKIIQDYEREKRVIFENYDNDIMNHENKISNLKLNLEENKKLLNNQLKETIREINNRIRKVNDEIKQMLQESKKEIKEKYNRKHLEILADKKEKVKLL